MDTSATHADEMLTLTLDVEDAERRQHKRSSQSDSAFFSHENSEQSEGLGMPLALPTSPTLLLTTSPSATVAPHRHQQLNVSSYFQTESNGAAGDFNTEMQKSNDEYRRLTDAINLNVPNVTGTHTGKYDSSTGRISMVPSQGMPLEMATSTTTTSPPPRKKRKAGTNVSVDLQTKIRLIEVAEQYQYDPKCASRSKQEGGAIAAQSGKEQMSGIRLAAQFGLNKSTVSRILKRKEEFKKAYYKDNISGCSKHINKKSKYEKVNRVVENWFDMSREKNGAVSDTHLREMGKRIAENMGVEDFRGSNGWLRSLRNRKEHTTRNLSLEAREIEKIKKDNEAIERIRQIFPNGVKDMAGFFKDLSTYLEKEGGGVAGFGDMSGDSSSSSSSGQDGTASYTDMEDDIPRDEEAVMAEELLKKKMIESLRTWSEELVEAEMSKIKKRGKPRQAAML